MKTREILNYLIIGITLFSIGYALYIESKQGVRVFGTDKVIDPFLYETGIFNNETRGINPRSTVYHINESELQSIKFKKMSEVLIFTIPIVLLLVFFNFKPNTDELVENQINAITGLSNNDFPNFIEFCDSLKKDLKTKKNIDNDKCIEYIFPIITYGGVILNKNWNFHLGIIKENGTFFYLKCISISGDKLNSEFRTIGKYDLSISEYDKNFADCYLEILEDPKYSLITSNQI